MLQACLNGSRAPGEHPALPVTPDQLAADAAAVVRAGAGALHVHPRRADGLESLAPADIGAALASVREAVDVPVGVSTGAWIEPDVGARIDAVRSWTVLPDFASVNVHEDGALEVARALLARGIGVEAGVWTPDAAAIFVTWDLAPDCLRVLFEPMDPDLADALATVEAIEAVLDEAGPALPRLLHGDGPTAWTVLDAAIARGYDTRIGLEDALRLPDGTPAAGNEELVARARDR